MKNPMMPDYMFPAFHEITPEFLIELGVTAVLADIDNTLAPYEQAEPDERIKGWIASLAAAGIGIAFVLKNPLQRQERVRLQERRVSLQEERVCLRARLFPESLRIVMSAEQSLQSFIL